MKNLPTFRFFKKIESVQYNVALAMAGAIKDSSHEKWYQCLGLEYHYQRRCVGDYTHSIKFFQLLGYATFKIYYCQLKVPIDRCICISFLQI